MKGQFKKGQGDNVWYLIIFGDADLLTKFANIWKSIRAKIEECNVINSVNPLYLGIKDMKDQFKKGKGDNVWYLIIFVDADILRNFANIWKSIRAKIEKNTGVIVQYDKDYIKIKF